MKKPIPQFLNALVGQNLSAVVFVQDYVQIQFNPPPTLNIYSKASVIVGGLRTYQGESGFANALIGQINKVLSAISMVSDDSLVLQFSDGTAIEISLKDEDRSSPEAGELVGDPERWVVF